MDEFQKPLRNYYEGRSLPADRAAAILAAGQAAIARRKRRRAWLGGLAAAAAIGVGILAGLSLRDTKPLHCAEQLATSDLASAVVSFFAQPEPVLGQISNDRNALKQWLASQGSPTAFEFPTAIAQLESFACQVLDVRGQRVSLLCFFLDETLAEGTQPTPTVAPDGQPRPRPLVHLLAAPRSAFRDPPQPGERVRLDPVGDWKFVSWATDEVVFVAASDAPVELLTKVFSAL
jgi:hypothetical protein